MKLKPGDKIFLMNVDELYQYAERNYVQADYLTESMVIGINKNEYNDIVSRNPHTIIGASSVSFKLENELYIYETWMIKRKIHSNIKLNDKLFEME